MLAFVGKQLKETANETVRLSKAQFPGSCVQRGTAASVVAENRNRNDALLLRNLRDYKVRSSVGDNEHNNQQGFYIRSWISSPAASRRLAVATTRFDNPSIFLSPVFRFR